MTNTIQLLKPLTLILGVLALLSCGTQSTTQVMTTPVEAVVEQSDDKTGPVIVKSPIDKYEYRFLQLDNELDVILIHRPEPGKSGAALAVARGSNHDQEDVLGIAHYLEHMLFLGTEKYPDPDGYSDFISKHGGSMNAFTSNEITNYFFDIGEEFFPEALDRFGQFFVAPLLDDTYVEREKNAVHSEYQMQMRTDGWRGYSVLKTVMNPNHPMSRFNIGSLETLKSADRDLVLKFYEDNYSADQMVLAVLSSRSLDELEQLVHERFDGVPNRNLGDPTLLPRIYTEESLPLAFGYKTVMANRSLVLEWPVPDLKPHYKSKPLGFIGFLVGHEGKGSLHELLVGRGWITSLGAGGNRDDNANSSFNVAISITDDGWEHVSEIRALVFEYIEMLQSSQLEEWRYDEQATMQQLDFMYRGHSSTPATVNRFTDAYFEYEPEDLIRGPFMMESFEPGLIQNYLSYLTRQNSVTSISAPDIETDQVEKWFNVPYTLNPPIDLDFEVDHTFQLPSKNQFVPEDTSIISTASNDLPKQIVDEDDIEVWHASDTTFQVPRSIISLGLRYQDYAENPIDVVHGSLLAELLNIALNVEAYPALMAGIRGNFSHRTDALWLNVNGYNDKQELLLSDMVQLLKEYQVDEAQLNTQKAELRKSYDNFKDTRPFRQAIDTTQQVFISTSWAPADLAQLVGDVTPESLATWKEEKLGQVSLRMLIVGNSTEQEAKEIASTLHESFETTSIPDRLPTVTQLADSYTLNLDIEHDDAVYLAVFQGETESIEERAALRLISQIISQAYFNELRTEQQLGYVTIAQDVEYSKHPHMVFLVQSDKSGTMKLRKSTRELIDAQREVLAAMEQPEFDSFKDGLLTALLEEDKNLDGRTARYFSDLLSLNREFDTREQIADAIRSLTLEDVNATYNRILDFDKPNQIELFSPGKFGTLLDGGTSLDSPTALTIQDT